MFPSNAIFNTRIDDTSRFPADGNSAAWISLVGRDTHLTPNWGTSSDPAQQQNYWGLPVNWITSAATQWPRVTFADGFPQKSDCATADSGADIIHGCSLAAEGNRRFPFPSGKVLAEGGDCGGPNSCGDHHVLVVDRGTCRLWESYHAFDEGGTWNAIATATWDLHSNAMRPDDWASADAAGLPITPLLAKANEAATGEIHHALRVTFRDSALAIAHVWPGRFAAGGDNPGAIPFGSLMRLRADFVIPDSWPQQAKAVALAAKRYGIYVSDNGPDFFVQGSPDSAWNPAASDMLRAITMGDMEFVNLGALTRDARWSPNSYAASW